MTFPSAIGGIPYHEDLAPSVIFAVAYGCLLPLVVCRFFDRKNLTTVLIGSSILTVGRIVTFSLRAAQATNKSKRFALGLTSFLQVDLAIGYIVIASDLTSILRTHLITPTYGSDTYVPSAEAGSRYRFWISSAKLNDPEGPQRGKRFPGMPPASTPDHPQTRRWIRICTILLFCGFLTALIMSGIAAGNFENVVEGSISAQIIISLRFASTGLAFGLILCIFAASIWGRLILPRINKRRCCWICFIAFYLSLVAIYRLLVMHSTTYSVQSIALGSLNGHDDKANFYICHALPEWLSLMLFFTINIRKEFHTGLVGDWRTHDETPKELKKRLERESAHRNRFEMQPIVALEQAMTR